jgi:thiamine biosynthesis protein ThiS
MEREPTLKIRLNGDEYSTDGPLSVEDLLRRLEIHPERVAVEVNLKIVKKQDYQTTILQEGDQVEVVSFVGGGNDGCLC